MRTVNSVIAVEVLACINATGAPQKLTGPLGLTLSDAYINAQWCFAQLKQFKAWGRLIKLGGRQNMCACIWAQSTDSFFLYHTLLSVMDRAPQISAPIDNHSKDSKIPHVTSQQDVGI